VDINNTNEGRACNHRVELARKVSDAPVSLEPASVRKRFVGRVGGVIDPIDLEYTPDVHTNPFTTRLLIAIFFLSGAAGSAQNADSAKSKQPIATVEGQTIYDDDLIPSVQTQLLRLRSQEYEIKKKALDSLIEQRLLEAAARKN
jgi:hypothetical protein